LLNLEALGDESFVPEGLRERVNVRQLLDGVEPEQKRREQQEGPPMVGEARTYPTYSLPAKNREILRDSLQRERAIHIKNLRRLEETKAQYGPLDVPLHIQNAIDQIQENLERIENSIVNLENGRD
jgi:hypothetical protein